MKECIPYNIAAQVFMLYFPVLRIRIYSSLKDPVDSSHDIPDPIISSILLYSCLFDYLSFIDENHENTLFFNKSNHDKAGRKIKFEKCIIRLRFLSLGSILLEHNPHCKKRNFSLNLFQKFLVTWY